MNQRIDISYKTILFVAGFIGLLWALYLIREVIILIFVAIIFMSALAPLVDFLAKWKLPRVAAIGVIYVIIIAIIAGLVTAVISPLIEQTTHLAQTLPAVVERSLPEGVVFDRSVIQQEFTNISKNAISFTLEIFNNVLTVISIGVLTFYLLIERKKLEEMIAQFFVGNKKERVSSLITKVEDKLGAWMRGQIILSLIIGTLSFIALSLLNIPYALPLAILAGFMEVVPVIGPIISAIPAMLVALLISPFMALIVGLAYFIIQQLENNIIVPQVMNRAVGLNPLFVILAIAIGGKLLGIPGALLAVPATVVIQIFVEDLLKPSETK